MVGRNIDLATAADDNDDDDNAYDSKVIGGGGTPDDVTGIAAGFTLQDYPRLGENNNQFTFLCKTNTRHFPENHSSLEY